VVDAFVASQLVVVSRLINRFGDGADVTGVRGRYRDVGMQCLISVGGVYRQCEVLVTLNTMARIRDVRFCVFAPLLFARVSPRSDFFSRLFPFSKI
jgi:hypothetical protein